MLSKNNKKLQIEKMEPQCQRFTIKKLTFGVASVLIGTTLSLYAGDTIASANDSNDETTEIIADRTSENAVLSNAETTMDEGNSETIPTSNNNVINSNSSAIVDDPVLSRIVTANNKAAELVADGDASESSSKNSSASETNEAATNEEDKQAGAATETATTTDNTKLSDTEASTNDSTVTEPKTADPQADQAQPAANTSFRAATTEDATETTATTTNLLPQTNEVTIKEEPMAKPDLKYYTGFIVGDDAAKNAILNTADFPENATYTWVTKPDVTKAGSTSGQVKVTFPDEFDPDYVHELLVTVPATVEDINMRNSTIEFNKPIFHVNEDIDSINDLLTRDYVQNTFIKKLTLANGTVFEGQALKDLLDAVVAEFSWGVDPDVDVAGDDIGARLRAKLNNRSSVTWPVKVDVIGAEAKTGLQTPWGTEIDAADTIANVDELKQFDKTDTPVSYAWKTKPNFKPGVGVDHNVTGVVVVNYPDGTTQDVTVSVLVDKSDADKFIESQGVKTQTVTVKRGEVIDPKQAFDGITDATKADLNVTGATFNTSVDTSATAQKDYPAMVTFADGSMTVVDIPVVVTEQAQDYAPVAKAIETGLNNLPTAESAIDVAASNLPTGTTYAWKQAPDVTTKGVKDAVVVVTYPDGSTDDVAVKVTVVAQNDEFIPSYKDKATVAGDTVTLEPTINDKNGKDATLPTGTRFEFEGTAPEKVTLDATTGVVTVTDPTVDTKVPAIVVTYPDGTKTTLTPTLTVYPLPESSAIEVAVKAELTPENAKQAVKNSATLPADAEYTWAKTPDTSEPGYLTGTVSVKYPNGTIKDVVVNVKVGTDAQINDPKTQEVKTPVGESPDASAGIENLGELPAGTKVKWKDPVDTTTPGHKEGTVVVTYPDGSSEEMTVPVKVGTDEQINDPESQEVKVALNGTPDAQEGIKNFDKLPEGTTVEWKEPVDTTTSGHKEGTVVVTYPDGTSEEVTVPVKVGTDEQINIPEGQEIKVALNGIPDANAGIKNLDKLPEGTKVEWKEPVDTMTPGHKEGTVVVTYPDGSSEEVTVPVKVGTDEQINDPESQEVKVALNGTPDAQEGIKNFDKLSEGTTVEWKEPVDTTTPGHKEGTVVVTYPDGTSEEVTVPVKVGTDEQINTPEGQDIEVEVNGTPNANEGIANLGDLPTGTNVAWKTPVDTTTPGTKEGTIVVTYPNGTSEEVTVAVKVGTDAEINDPKGQDLEVEVNGTPNANEGIANLGDLPTGTNVAWKAPVDTTTPGTKEGTIVVTYPDGTSKEVTVSIKVGTDNKVLTVNKLPQTGNVDNHKLVALGWLSLLAGLLQFGVGKRKKRDEK